MTSTIFKFCFVCCSRLGIFRCSKTIESHLEFFCFQFFPPTFINKRRTFRKCRRRRSASSSDSSNWFEYVLDLERIEYEQKKKIQQTNDNSNSSKNAERVQKRNKKVQQRNESWSNCGTESNCLLLPYISPGKQSPLLQTAAPCIQFAASHTLLRSNIVCVYTFAHGWPDFFASAALS